MALWVVLHPEPHQTRAQQGEVWEQLSIFPHANRNPIYARKLLPKTDNRDLNRVLLQKQSSRRWSNQNSPTTTRRRSKITNLKAPEQSNNNNGKTKKKHAQGMNVCHKRTSLTTTFPEGTVKQTGLEGQFETISVTRECVDATDV